VSKKKCVINGFGRFGLHFLKNYLDGANDNFEIICINDEVLDIDNIYNIIVSDEYVNYIATYIVRKSKDSIWFNDKEIKFINKKINEISELEDMDYLLEFSGRNTDAKIAENLLRNNEQQVIISATSYNANQTLIYGFNHEEYKENVSSISYGSCTVNALIPLAAKIHGEFEIKSLDVNVVHNLPRYITEKNKPTLKRQFCTLAIMAPKLLNFVSSDNFNVNYTLVPYNGVSIIDFSFDLGKKPLSVEKFFKEIFRDKKMKYLYGVIENDNGPEEHKMTSKSAVLIKDKTRLVGSRVYISAYFDNENSSTRYLDLINYITKK
jgi:glyceraldehyde 3-phosphate dehydrogenase